MYLSGSAATYYCHCGMCGIDRRGKDNTLPSGMRGGCDEFDRKCGMIIGKWRVPEYCERERVCVIS